MDNEREWVDSKCGCTRSPDVARTLPCPAHNGETVTDNEHPDIPALYQRLTNTMNALEVADEDLTPSSGPSHFAIYGGSYSVRYNFGTDCWETVE